MDIQATKTELAEILNLRKLYLEEMNTQIRYNAVHERGRSDTYILSIDGIKVGYGSVLGQDAADRDTIFELYVIPAYRKISSVLFRELLMTSNAKYIECQSNDPLLSSMLFEFGDNIHSDVILFSDHHATHLPLPGATHLSLPGAIFRKRKETDTLFEHKHEPEGTHVIEFNGEIVATGGFLLHYNMPFSDLYMEVREDVRQGGVGSYLIQEVKRECYLAGRVPAARCNINNHASKATLIKAGLKIAGFMMFGTVRSKFS
jgi:GNAT superfamily N-acetyltransferase